MCDKSLSSTVLWMLINIFSIFINTSEGRMICRQEEFGVNEVLHCPDSGNFDLGYCCINNGKVSCCSYDDYKERHFGPSFTTLLALGVSHIILLPALIYFWYKRRRRDEQQK